MNHDDGDGGHGCNDDEKFQNINDSVPELKVASRQTAQNDHKVDWPNSLLAGYVQNLVQTLLHFVYSICDSHSLYVHPEVRSLFVGCVRAVAIPEKEL